MKTTRRLIQFRTQPETQKKEDNRSRAGKIAQVLGGAAVIGGAGYMIAKKFKVKEAAHIASKAEGEAKKALLNKVKTAEYIGGLNRPAPKPTKANYTGGGKFDYGVKPAPAAPAPKPAAPVAKPAQPASLLRPGEKGPLSSFAADRRNKIAIAARKAAAKSAPEQTVKIVANRKPAASAPSTPISAKVRAASDAVLAADIAKKAKAKKVKVSAQSELGLSAIHQKMINFQERRSDNRFGTEINPLSAYRKASRVVPWVNRASEAAGDVGDIASGKKVKDPFYQKAWFKRAAQTAAIGVGVAGLHLRNRSIERHNDGRLTDGTADKVGAWIAKKTGGIKQMSAKPNKLIVALKAHARLVEFARGDQITKTLLKWGKKTGTLAETKKGLKFSKDILTKSPKAVATYGEDGLRKIRSVAAADFYKRRHEFATVDPLEKGWDLRDARGRSARVYAPGSKKRDRREKDWGEKTDNIRMVRNAAIVTAAGLGGLAIHQGLKLRKANTALKTASAPGPKVHAGPVEPGVFDATHLFKKQA